jgi:hypothetical protein
MKDALRGLKSIDSGGISSNGKIVALQAEVESSILSFSTKYRVSLMVKRKALTLQTEDRYLAPVPKE